MIERRFREIAGALIRKERNDHTWQETMLVDDAFWKMVDGGAIHWENREQFFCSAAKVMRRLLVDHARQKKAQKRGGSAVVLPLDEQQERPRRHSNRLRDIVELNDLLETLEAKHPNEFQVFDLHYFMGCVLREIADDILRISYPTVKRRWSEAKRILQRELADG